MTDHYTSIFLGILSIIIAVGISIFALWNERRIRNKNEEFFAEQIKNNLEKMAQYFQDVESETKYDEEYDITNENMMRSLNTFFLRNEQEMKDILYQTRIYLPFWTNLSTKNRKTVNEIMDTFSWLLYEYYQKKLPESLRENIIISSRKKLFDKKEIVINTTGNILEQYKT